MKCVEVIEMWYFDELLLDIVIFGLVRILLWEKIVYVGGSLEKRIIRNFILVKFFLWREGKKELSCKMGNVFVDN